MLLAVLLLASQIEINTQVDKQYVQKRLTIGDPFAVTLTVTHSQADEISEPFIDSLEPFVVLEQTNKVVQEKGLVKNTYHITMVPFSAGDLEIPVFKFLHTRADTIDTLRSEIISIPIASVLPENMTDINDIEKAVEYPDYRPLLIAGIIAACCLFGFIGYKYYKKWRLLRATARPAILPWVEALAAIDNIPIEEWFRKGLIKRYYYTLSEILKWYLERRFAFNAAEQTTTELTATLKMLKVPMRKEFNEFFNRADMVKYAKLIPPQDELQSAVHRAKNLVNGTKPAPEENKA